MKLNTPAMTASVNASYRVVFSGSVSGLRAGGSVLFNGKLRNIPRGFMGKREPQIILKNDERKVVLELGLEEKFAPKSTGWTKTGFSSKATRSRSRQERPPSRICRPSRLSPSPGLHYRPDDE